MAKKGGNVDKMLCQIYNSRGNLNFDLDEWDEFCEENDLDEEFVSGGRKKQTNKRETYDTDDE